MTDALSRPDGTELGEALVAQIQDKVNTLLMPMQIAMDRNQWGPEFRRIMWEAIALEAIARRDKATRQAAGIKDD